MPSMVQGVRGHPAGSGAVGRAPDAQRDADSVVGIRRSGAAGGALRVSSYVIGAELNAQWYVLMHGYTGAVDKVPHRVGRYLVEHRGQSCDLTGPPLSRLSHDSLTDLVTRGYLTDRRHSDEREAVLAVAATLHERNLAEASGGFMFVPTYQCNLRCSYCFQPHGMHAGQGSFSAVMSHEQVDDAFAIIDELSAPGSVASALGVIDVPAAPDTEHRSGPIGLFGGEPLWSPTYDVVEHIVKASIARGREVSAITNGVELDVFEPLLGPVGISEVQITIDGLAPTHDGRRYRPGKLPTFERIADNIDLALASEVRVMLRINVDADNIAELDALEALIEERGWSSHDQFTAHGAAVTPHGFHAELVTRADLVDATMSRRGRGVIESYERYAFDALHRALMGDGYPFRRVVNCSAETGLLLFDPLGDVYACWEDVGHSDQRIARYSGDGIDFDIERARPWLLRFPGSIEECSACPYALIHASGCAQHARERTGTMFAADCDHFQEYFPRTLAAAYADFEGALFDNERDQRVAESGPIGQAHDHERR